MIITIASTKLKFPRCQELDAEEMDSRNEIWIRGGANVNKEMEQKHVKAEGTWCIS